MLSLDGGEICTIHIGLHIPNSNHCRENQKDGYDVNGSYGSFALGLSR